MSYTFDGGDRMTGALNATHSIATTPLTISMWVRYPSTYVFASDLIINFGTASNSKADSVSIQSDTVEGQFRANTFNASATSAGAANKNPGRSDDTWFLLVGTWEVPTTATDRSIYVNGSTSPGTNTGEYAPTALAYIALGSNLATSVGEYWGSAAGPCYIAEVGIWNTLLTSTQIDELVTKAPLLVQSANLIGYWPLSSSNSTQANDGSDTGGDLTVSGATYSSEHPSLIYTTGGANKLFGKLAGPFHRLV